MEAVEIGPASAQALLTWDTHVPSAVWLRTSRGPLHVRADVVQSCFAPAAPPPEAFGLIRTPVGRCEVDHKLTTCMSSLGAWEGAVSNTAVSLRMVRRTLGVFHLLEGVPVQSGRFARSVVAVEMAKPHNARETTLYATMQQAVQAALSSGDGSVRAVPPSDPDATLRISVALHNLVIGDLAQHTSTEQTTYEDHKETRPNPEKDKARAAVATANANLQAAIADFQNRQEAAKQAHETCLAGCAAFGGMGAAACRTGCGVGGVLLTAVVDSDPAVQQAHEAVNQATNTEAATPLTIEVPIMLPWSYKKTSYQRSVSVALDVDAKFPSGPRHWSKPLATSVDDYEVAGDARHNVTGHAVARDIIDRPDSLLPLIGRLIVEELATRVRGGINQEREERAIKTLEASGHEVARPENRAVDAAAFDIAGDRIERVAQHGTADLGASGAFAVPAEAAAPSCLLVVGAAEDPEAHLKLTTADGSHADLRGGSVAVIEVCPGEPGGTSPPKVELSSSKAVQARWGVYLVSPEKRPAK